MNDSAPRKLTINWRKVIPVVTVLLLAAYQYGQPTLEKWFDVSLPAVADNSDSGQRSAGRDGDSRSTSGADDRYRVTFPADDQKPSSKSSKKSQRFELKEVGRDRFLTPAGLLYTMGPRQEHRIDHVMLHNQDDPDSRETHSVFSGCSNQNEVLQLIDEAYELVKSQSPQVQYEKSRGNDAYTVDMKRKIGYQGGVRGKKKGYPARSKIRLILTDNNRVITAYPSN